MLSPQCCSLLFQQHCSAMMNQCRTNVVTWLFSLVTFIMPEQHVVSCLKSEQRCWVNNLFYVVPTCMNNLFKRKTGWTGYCSGFAFYNTPIRIEGTYNQPITFFVYDSKIMAKAVKVHLFSDDRPCNLSDNLSRIITCLFFTAEIINFEIYWVQDTGTEFYHKKTQYNDVKTKDKSITKRQRLYSTWNIGLPKGAVFPLLCLMLFIYTSRTSIR